MQFNIISLYSSSYLLKNLNVNPYGSKVTVFGASDASIIVNTTDYLNDLFTFWNYTTHNQSECSNIQF